ncbi:hypothetical protein BGZ54_005447 [Gamsiella multidivaricata]|nr:hypothetical protein BGZ54_005447 [Gamsiella multidivaricata]
MANCSSTGTGRPKRKSNIVIEIPPWLPTKKQTHAVAETQQIAIESEDEALPTEQLLPEQAQVEQGSDPWDISDGSFSDISLNDLNDPAPKKLPPPLVMDGLATLVPALFMSSSLYGHDSVFSERSSMQALPSSSISEEGAIWADNIVRHDVRTGQYRYAYLDPEEPSIERHQIILEEAYKAYEHQIDQLEDEDYEFIAAAIGITAAIAKSWMWERASYSSQPQSLNNIDKPLATDHLSIKRRSIAQSDSPKKTTKVLDKEHSIITTTAKRIQRRAVVRTKIPSENRALQSNRCEHYAENQPQLEQCNACTNRRACAFVNFRLFYIRSQQDVHSFDKYNYRHGPDFYSDPDPDTEFQFNKRGLFFPTSSYILAYTHTLAKHLLKSEIDHALGISGDRDNESESGSERHYFRRPLTDRQFCDVCKTSMASGHWMCCICGQDMCMDCYESFLVTTHCTYKRMHEAKQFIPCGRFHLSTLRQSLGALETRVEQIPKGLLNAPNKAADGSINASLNKYEGDGFKHREPVKADSESFGIDSFRAAWLRGGAIVLSGVHKRLRRDWSPAYLKRIHGKATVTAVDIATREAQVMTLQQYLDQHFTGKTRQGAETAWKMSGWPLEPFQDVLKELFHDLLRALPLPEYTRPHGAFNLARYFPVDQVGLDLSPKLYACQGLGMDLQGCKSIPMSCEISDSLYLCVYTHDPHQRPKVDDEDIDASASTSAVIWDIFRVEDRHLVREFLHRTYASRLGCNLWDGFSDQRFHMTPSQQRQLFEEKGVRAYRVIQRYGDAVMIPAGCPRQAHYIQDSILVGLDFVSPERISHTLHRSEELRGFNLEKKAKRVPDVLMAKDILFYSTLAML